MRKKIFFFVVFSYILYSQTSLWFITEGGNGYDNSWSVAIDNMGTIWWPVNKTIAGYEENIFIYKIDSTGFKYWNSLPWGDSVDDRIYIAVVKDSFLYVGGNTNFEAAYADALLIKYLIKDTLELKWAYPWDQNHGYEEVDGIVVEDDGIYISGWTTPDTNYPFKTDIFIQKIDFDGNLIWSTTWGTPLGTEGANGHMVSDQNNLYIVSHYGPFPFGDAIILAFSKDGNYLWHRVWRNTPFIYDDFYGLAMSSDSFLYAVGVTVDPAIADSFDIILVKYTRNGDKVWERVWGGSGIELARAIVTDGDSIIYIAGNTESYGAGKKDIVLLKYASDGTLLSYKVWGGIKNDVSHEVIRMGKYLYIAGETESFGSDTTDAILIKVNGRTMEFPDTTTFVKEISEYKKFQFLLFPNPCRDFIKIKTTAKEILRLNVYNESGRIFKEVSYKKFPSSHLVKIDIRKLKSGKYFIYLETKNGVYSMKFLKIGY